MMGCASRRDTRMLLLALIVAFAGALGVAGGWHAPRTEAQAGAYRWWLRDDEPPQVDLVVLPVDRSDWAPYVDASNARLDAWLRDPSAAPALDGTYVTLTFRRAVSVPLLSAIIAPLRARVAKHTAVGVDDRGDVVEEVTFGAPDPAAFEAEQFDPGADYSFRLTGIVEAELWIGVEGPVAASDLDAVRDHESVYLVDTTAIQVLRVDMPAFAGTTAPVLDGVVMDGPWHAVND